MFNDINKEKAKYEKHIVIGYFLTGIAFVAYIPLAASYGPAMFFVVGIFFIGGGLYAGMYHKKIKALSNAFKQKYVVQEMKKLFPDSEYFYDQGFSETEVVESGLLYNRDRFRSEDLMVGNFEGVGFRCCDVEQKEVRRSGKHTRVVTVFKGRFYEFDFPKPFKYNLQLLQPYNFRPFSGLKKVKSESINFNSELKIYAQSEHEAFYILTPQMMERLLYMDQKYTDKISFSFKNKRLYIAIDSREDYFDIKAFTPVDQTIFQAYHNELENIIDFIKVLQLDEHLFSQGEQTKA